MPEEPVVDGLYCSYRCGGFPEPYGDDNIENAPRMCRTMRNGHWAWKKRWGHGERLVPPEAIIKLATRFANNLRG